MGARAAVAALRRAAAINPAVLVALSGGKDSLAVLELCVEAFPRVEAFFMWLVPGLKSVEGPAETAARRHGIKLHKIPHWNLRNILTHGLYSPRIRGLDIPRTSIRTVEAALRSRTGIEWVAYGHKMVDGISRRFYLRKRGPTDDRCMRLAPLWDWKDGDVISFNKARGIPTLATRMGRRARGRVTGFSLRPECITWLRENHPEDYRRALEFFPDLEAIDVRSRIPDDPTPDGS